MLVVNGTALSDHGFTGTIREVPRLGGERTALVTPPGSLSATRLGATYESGRMSVDGWVKGTSHADLLAKLDAIAALLNNPAGVILGLTDITDREWVGRLQPGGRAGELGPQQASKHARLSLEFALLGPARAPADTVMAASGALVLGTAPSPLRIEVTNAPNAPITRVIVRIRDGGAGGLVTQELQWDGSVDVSEVLVIDAETFSVTNDGANAIGGLTAASDFPTPDPLSGDDYAEVAITGGAGSTFEVTYRRRWLV